MSTVKNILQAGTPRPTQSIRPGLSAPLPAGMSWARPDVGNPDPTAQTLDPRSGLFEGKSADTPRVYGGDQGYLLETGQETNLFGNSESASAYSASSGVSLSTNSSQSVRKGGSSVEAEVTGGGATNIFCLLGGQPDNTRYTVTRWVKHTAGTDTEVQINWGGSHNGNRSTATVDLTTGTLTTKSEVSGEYVRAKKKFNGWVEIVVTTTTGTNSNNNNVIPQFNLGSIGQKILVVTQIQKGSTHAAYIPTTNGSQTSRGSDRLELFSGGQPSWWPSEATILTEIVPLYYEHSRKMDLLYTSATKRFFWQLAGAGWETRDDTGNKINVASSFSPFQSYKIALSLTRDEMRLAVNGKTATGTHDGTLLDVSKLNFGRGQGRAQTLLKSWSIIPVAHPATPSDRGANDPVSIETLTS